MQSLSKEISSPTLLKGCECYKKLRELGIPLYITEENDLYTEGQKVVPYENAFRGPGILQINEDVAQYPIVEENELFLVFQRMTQVLPSLSDFEQNVLSFWILDVFVEGLWTAQTAKMSHSHQKATLLWIAYFFNYIQTELYIGEKPWKFLHQEGVFQQKVNLFVQPANVPEKNPSRRELFHHLKAILFRSDKTEEVEGETETKSCESERKIFGEDYTPSKFKKTWRLPLPPKLSPSVSDTKSFSSEEREENTWTGNDEEKLTKSSLSSASELKEEESDAATNLQHMNVILEILYRIFARRWVYLEMQTVFHAMPPVQEVDLPFTLNVPKPLFRPEPSIQIKVEKGGKRPSFSEKSYEEIEIERQLHKHDYILPLQMAEESKLYLKQLSGQPTSDRSGLNRNRKN